MSFGVDALGALTEKLKQLINDTQDKYESFIDDTQLYKQGKINEKEFFTRIGEYLISSSAMNFLAIRVILEIKSAMEKGTSLKNSTGGMASPAPTSQAGFGVGSFIGTGGTVGSGREYTLPAPEPTARQEPLLRSVDIETEHPTIQQSERESERNKNCIVCGSTIPRQAKFCNKCGNSQ